MVQKLSLARHKFPSYCQSGKQCRIFPSEPGRVGPEIPGRHAPALIYFPRHYLYDIQRTSLLFLSIILLCRWIAWRGIVCSRRHGIGIVGIRLIRVCRAGLGRRALVGCRLNGRRRRGRLRRSKLAVDFAISRHVGGHERLLGRHGAGVGLWNARRFGRRARRT